MYLNHSPTLIQWRFGTRVKLDHLYTYPCLNTYTLKQSYAHVGLTTESLYVQHKEERWMFFRLVCLFNINPYHT